MITCHPPRLGSLLISISNQSPWSRGGSHSNIPSQNVMGTDLGALKTKKSHIKWLKAHSCSFLHSHFQKHRHTHMHMHRERRLRERGKWHTNLTNAGLLRAIAKGKVDTDINRWLNVVKEEISSANATHLVWNNKTPSCIQDLLSF